MGRFLLITYCLAGCSGFAQSSMGGAGAVSGYVYCADSNTPARMATVRVQSVDSLGGDLGTSKENGSGGAVTSTGFDGAFRVEALPPGDYVLLATLRGYLFPLATYTWGDLAVDRDTKNNAVRKRIEEALPRVSVVAGQTASVAIRLERGAEISGTVSFDDGAPAIGADIEVYRTSEDTRQWETVEQPMDSLLTQMSTDSRGRYRVPGLPPGKYLVAVRLPQHSGSDSGILGGNLRAGGAGFQGHFEIYFGDTLRQKLAGVVQLSSGQQRADVDIHIPQSKMRTISGTVTAASDGHPIKNTVFGLFYAGDDAPVLQAYGGDSSEFQIPFVLDGQYTLSVSASPEQNHQVEHKYETVKLPLDVDGDVRGIDVALPDAATPK